MLPIKKILCPTDFSEPAMASLQVGIELAENFAADLLLVHVIGPVQILAGNFAMSGAQAVQIVESMQFEANKQMDQLLRTQVPGHIHCDSRIVQGQPGDKITQLAEEEEVDLIVTATHGYSGFNRFLFGSVAERIIRKATCPVLTIKPEQAVH